MAAPFYNEADQAIYEGGEHFIPQEQYRLGYTAPPSIANAQTTSGVTNTQAAYPYKWPPLQGAGDGPSGLHNVYGYDPNKTKTFSKQVWSKTGPTEGWTTQDVTGYWSPSGWKTAKGKNINHAGLEVPTLIGTLMNKTMGIKPGEKQVGDIKGTFTKDLTEEEEKINAAAVRRSVLNKIRAKAYRGPINVGGGGQDIDPGGDGTTGGTTLGTSTPAAGQTWHPGVGGNGNTGGLGTDTPAEPGGWGPGAAQGGRIGYATRGFVDPEEPAENIFEIMQDQNIPFSEQVEGEGGILEQLVAKYIEAGFPPDQAQEMAMQEFQQMSMGSEQGIASLV